MTGFARGGHPNSIDALRRGAAAGRAQRIAKRLAGLAWARDWRVRNRPLFDALYGGEACDG